MSILCPIYCLRTRGIRRARPHVVHGDPELDPVVRGPTWLPSGSQAKRPTPPRPDGPPRPGSPPVSSAFRPDKDVIKAGMGLVGQSRRRSVMNKFSHGIAVAAACSFALGVRVDSSADGQGSDRRTASMRRKHESPGGRSNPRDDEGDLVRTNLFERSDRVRRHREARERSEARHQAPGRGLCRAPDADPSMRQRETAPGSNGSSRARERSVLAPRRVGRYPGDARRRQLRGHARGGFDCEEPADLRPRRGLRRRPSRRYVPGAAVGRQGSPTASGSTRSGGAGSSSGRTKRNEAPPRSPRSYQILPP
jgi:hypothetical protein